MNNVTVDNVSEAHAPIPSPSPESLEPTANGADTMSMPTTDGTTPMTDAPPEIEPTVVDVPNPVEPSRSPASSDLAVALAYWIYGALSDRGVTRATAYAVAIAVVRQTNLGDALRSARAVLGPLPLRAQRAIREYSNRRAAIQRARSNGTPDEYGPSTRPARFQRLRAIRFLTAGGERHETRVVRARCPVCQQVTSQVLELNLPIYVAISCIKCRPTSKRSRKPHYCPSPFYLRAMLGPNGVIAANVDGAIRLLSSIMS